MKRAVLYARYSTDLQNERSVEDQFALCRGYAARERYQVVGEFSDRARSGGSMMERTGLLDLVAQAQRADRGFDVLIVEALDRLSRDMEDLAGLHKRFKYHGVTILAVHEGEANTVLVGLRGLVGQLFREDGAKKIKRGLSGVVRSGRAAGGRAYGYDVVLGKPGERTINETEAEVVRRIFSDYASGRAPRWIAAALNRDGVPPPRSGLWNASTLNGSSPRGNGILNNELYVGRIVWNKVPKARNPYTGRRVPRVGPTVERETSSVPHLQIIDDETWAIAQARRAAARGIRPEQHRRPKHLLSGLLRCHACGSGMSMKDRDKSGKIRVRCSAVAESGSCDHRRAYYLPAIESAVLSGFQLHLRRPKLIETYVRTYNAARQRLARTALRDRSKLQARLAQIEVEYERLVSALTKGLITDEDATSRLPPLRAEKDAILADLARGDDGSELLTLNSAVVGDYLKQIDRLSDSLNERSMENAEVDEAPILAARSLIHSVIVLPTEAKQPIEVEVRGLLSELVSTRESALNRGERWCRLSGPSDPPETEALFTFRAKAA